MPLTIRRAEFNTETAPRLAAVLGFHERWPDKGSSRFAYFLDSEAKRFLLIAGRQEGSEVDRALAYGLSYGQGRELTLLLPMGFSFPTRQRAPWLKAEAQPRLFEHDGESIVERALSSRQETIDALIDRLPDGDTSEEELRRAATPVHFQTRNAAVEQLFEWATQHPLLDPGHRKGERAWHCFGQKVLKVNGSREGLSIRAGIQTTVPTSASPTVTVKTGETLTDGDLATLKGAVEVAIKDRLDEQGSRRRSDEHWLQAVIRKNPSLVGVEQPALREVPAWRPNAAGHTDDKSCWGRGYIDLLGADAFGDLRIVETKLSGADDLLVLQGLDYYVWALAYESALRKRLGMPKTARLQLHYVLGATEDGRAHMSPYAKRHSELLDVDHRFQVVHDWHRLPSEGGRPLSELIPRGQLPQ